MKELNRFKSGADFKKELTELLNKYNAELSISYYQDYSGIEDIQLEYRDSNISGYCIFEQKHENDCFGEVD